jgi:hypothetical protein
MPTRESVMAGQPGNARHGFRRCGRNKLLADPRARRDSLRNLMGVLKRSLTKEGGETPKEKSV